MGLLEKNAGKTGAPYTVWTSQASWYVDSSLGSDGGAGTQADPIKTLAHLFSVRLPPGSTLRPASVVDPNGSGLTARFVDVYIVSPLPSTDPISFDLIGSPDTVLRFWGLNATTTYTGSITGGLVTRVQSTNTPWSFQDTAVPSAWAALGMGMRIRNTNVTRAGQITWTMKDLTAQTVRTCEWLPRPIPPNLVGAAQAPVAGDTYVLERLQSAFVGRCSWKTPGSGTNARSVIGFTDLELTGTNNLFGQQTIISDAGARCIFSGCRFVAPSGAAANFFFQTGLFYFQNCCFSSANAGANGTATLQSAIAQINLQAGLTFTLMGPFIQGGAWNISNDCMMQGAALNMSGATLYAIGASGVGGLGIFDSPGFTGAAVVVGFDPQSTLKMIAGNLWGANNSGYGVRVRPGGTFVCATPANISITGTVGDFELSGSALGWSFNPATAVYEPAGGLATTWANFQAARGVAGFGGNALHPGTQCGIYTNA